MLKHNKQRATKTLSQINKEKETKDNIFKSSLLVLASTALFFSIIIIIFIVIKGFEGVFYGDGENSLWDNGFWLFGNKYDGVAFFAAGFMVVNTLWTSFIAVLIALPISVLTALFVTRVAPKSMRTLFFVSLSILAAIPSVIYGAFGSKVIDSVSMFLFGANSGSLLTIVVTLAFMIMPTITLITAATINSIDIKMEQSSLALGATKNQTSFYITIRAASTGIMAGTILGVGRALGEATAVTMISIDPYVGPSFGLLSNIRLLTATMLKGYNEMAPGSIQQASMYAMAMLLIITILFVFISMRYLQKISSPEYKSKKATKKLLREKNLISSIDSNGLKNLSVSDQKKYYSLNEAKKLNNEFDKYYHAKYRKKRIITNTTVKRSYDSVKQKKSSALGFLTWFMSALGLIFLTSIILFLLILGVPAFHGTETSWWEFISTSDDGGIKTSIFGTLLLVFLSLIFIIPLGIGAGLYFATFAKKGSKFNEILILGIDILAGIPSIIFGIVGAMIFLPMAKAIGFVPLAGAFTLSLIVLPTVIQTTRQGINSVPHQTISGSLSLGSTKTTSSLKIALPQAMPQIISGVVLSIGRMVGESAAIIMIFGTATRNSSIEWIQDGGTTLATAMYSLTLLEEIPWNQVCAIGLVILSLILILSLLSNYIAHRNKIGSFGVLLSLLLMITGIFIGNVDGLVIFWIAILMLITTIVISRNKGKE